jgi:hypothetical protein
MKPKINVSFAAASLCGSSIPDRTRAGGSPVEKEIAPTSHFGQGFGATNKRDEIERCMQRSGEQSFSTDGAADRESATAPPTHGNVQASRRVSRRGITPQLL